MACALSWLRGGWTQHGVRGRGCGACCDCGQSCMSLWGGLRFRAKRQHPHCSPWQYALRTQ
eukprot:6505726-Prorocentrum_lima.AAC.1